MIAHLPSSPLPQAADAARRAGGRPALRLLERPAPRPVPVAAAPAPRRRLPPRLAAAYLVLLAWAFPVLSALRLAS